MVHAEIVLQGDGSKGLCSRFNLHTLLSFDGLVQSVAVSTALHDTACLLIHNLHLSFGCDDVLVVALEHGVGFEQLVDGVHAFALHLVVGHQGFLLLHALLFAQILLIFQLRELAGDVGQDEEGGVGGVAANQFDTLIRQIHAVELFINDEVEGLCHFGHTLVVLLHVDLFGLEHTGLDALFAEELDQGLVFG